MITLAWFVFSFTMTDDNNKLHVLHYVRLLPYLEVHVHKYDIMMWNTCNTFVIFDWTYLLLSVSYRIHFLCFPNQFYPVEPPRKDLSGNTEGCSKKWHVCFLVSHEYKSHSTKLLHFVVNRGFVKVGIDLVQ